MCFDDAAAFRLLSLASEAKSMRFALKNPSDIQLRTSIVSGTLRRIIMKISFGHSSPNSNKAVSAFCYWHPLSRIWIEASRRIATSVGL